MSVDNNNNQLPPDATVTPPSRPQTPSDAGDMMQMMGQFIPAGFKIMATLMQEEGKVGGVEGAKGPATFEQVKDNAAYVTGATSGMSITNPQLPTPDHATVDKALEDVITKVLNGEDLFGGSASPELVKVATSLYSTHLQSLGIDPASMRGGAGPSQPEALSYLGGLVAVSLFEILSKFAKTQSDSEKMASETKLKLQKSELEAAKDEAQLVLDKASIQVAALMAQMVIGIAACAVQIGGTMGALKGMHQVGGMGAQEASMVNSLWSGTADLIRTSDKGVEAMKTYMVAQKENQEMLLRAFKEMIQRGVQSTDKMGDDAHALVEKTLELLKQMLGAMAQQFNKIGH